MTDKKTEQGEAEATRSGAGGEPEGLDRKPDEIAAEGDVGAQETPTERQQQREQAIVDEPVAESEQRIAEATQPTTAGSPSRDAEAEEDDEPEAPRVKPEIPGMDLEPDLAPVDESGAISYSEDEDPDAVEEDAEEEDTFAQPIADAAIDLGADARYRATGKRKTAVARVTLRPGTGAYTINGRTLEVFFPRATLQRTIRQPLETVGFEDRMDVIATMHGGGVSAQADALRHGISRALLEADPNLRGELKRRGFLTRDARAKERKKAGLKKARKRPQFSKR
jgi:small subunit ribosomal protein S9